MAETDKAAAKPQAKVSAAPVVDELLERAQAKAPSLTAEFCDKHGLTDEYLEGVASGLIPPPPTVGPNPGSDLHFINGMWVNVPSGVSPENANSTGGYGPNDGRVA